MAPQKSLLLSINYYGTARDAEVYHVRTQGFFPTTAGIRSKFSEDKTKQNKNPENPFRSLEITSCRKY